MQVDPIQPALQAPKTKRLKLQVGEPLPIFGVKFDLRRYDEGHPDKPARPWRGGAG